LLSAADLGGKASAMSANVAGYSLIAIGGVAAVYFLRSLIQVRSMRVAQRCAYEPRSLAALVRFRFHASKQGMAVEVLDHYPSSF